MRKPRVLVLGAHNASRSQMAEGFLRQLGGERFELYSAGLEPLGLHELTRQVMAEVGIDVSAHRASDVRDFLGRLHFGYLITVCASAERDCPTFPGLAARLYWPIDDPLKGETATGDERLDRFRQVRDEIGALCRQWLSQVREANGANDL